MENEESNQFGEAGVQERDLRVKDFPAPVGNDVKSRCEYVMAIYDHAVATTDDAINWYLINKVPQKWWARRIRLVAIIFTAIGALIPLIVASRILSRWSASVEFSQFGYVSLALAAACVGLDKYFGFSSAWIRYLTTATVLQRLLHEFCLDWAILYTSHEGQSEAQIEPMLRRIQTFVMRVRGEMERETADWAAEYRSNLAEMEKAAREQLDLNRPGSISLTVANASKAGASGVTVLLDGASIQTITTPDCLLSPVFPGEHVVTVRGTIDNKLLSVSAPVRIEPGRPHLLTLKLAEGNA